MNEQHTEAAVVLTSSRKISKTNPPPSLVGSRKTSQGLAPRSSVTSTSTAARDDGAASPVRSPPARGPQAIFAPMQRMFKETLGGDQEGTHVIRSTSAEDGGTAGGELTKEEIEAKRSARIVIQGPVAHEMLFLFLVFIPIVSLAEEIGFATHIRHPVFLPYLLVAWMVYQMSRLVYVRNQLR